MWEIEHYINRDKSSKVHSKKFDETLTLALVAQIP